MKKWMVLLAFVSSAAFAQAGGDQYSVVYNCGPAVQRPDIGMNLKLLVGGLAGGTTIRINRFELGKRSVQNYFVREQSSRGRMGAALIYTGNGISFSINLTTAPRQDGKRPATLVTDDYGTESLLCKVN